MSLTEWVMPLSDEDEEAVAQTIAAAARRVKYRLTYDAAKEDREVHSTGIAGPDLPNAYYVMGGPKRPDGTRRSRTGSGDWEDPDHGFMGSDATEEDHIDRWGLAVVSEAVHEALEWFWVDGKPWLDPHGDAESQIHELCAEFAKNLAALRAEGPS